MTSSSAGYVERFFFASLASDLRAGKMQTLLNGAVVDEADARRLVAYAQACGWMDIPSSPTDQSRTGCAPS
jgi:hypothetical protein